jgi:hypothetical protein
VTTWAARYRGSEWNERLVSSGLIRLGVPKKRVPLTWKRCRVGKGALFARRAHRGSAAVGTLRFAHPTSDRN